MHVEIGPLPSSCVLAWLDVTLRFLRVVRDRADDLPFVVPDAVLASIYGYLNAWVVLADDGEEFHWVSDEDPDRVRLALEYGYNLALLGHEQRERLELPLLSPEAEAFERAMIAGFRAAAERAGDDAAWRVAERWPSPAAVDPPDA